uniref:MD-2-related lipid-recognition domain-containing protein n=1 Tax=Trichuris muris TaxID=70415 RepID=A0A5S6Q3F5_TRIMR
MLLRILAAALCLSLVQPRCSDPDGTELKLFFSECHKDKTHSLNITNVVILNEHGEDNYPINMKKLMNLKVESTNKGSTLNSIIADIELQYYGSILWGACGWHNVPTFGLLHGIKECYNCPLKPGENVLELRYDFSPYASLIRTLAGGGVYAMDIALRDGENTSNEVGCLRIESKISN